MQSHNACRAPLDYVSAVPLPDLNLLIVLDALLAEGSVAGAARRLHLSPSAMSRSLARLRDAIGDPLLVRAGRDLVPTPRALELRERISPLLREVAEVLNPAKALDLSRLVRTFTFRNREGFVETFGARLVERVAREAPGVRILFVSKPDRESGLLRSGDVDLETGVVGEGIGPEVKARHLFRDRFIGAMRIGHVLGKGRMTVRRFATAQHVAISRRPRHQGPVDLALERQGLKRNIAAVVDSFSEALALVRSSDLIACVPERYTSSLRDGIICFPLPLPPLVVEIGISLLWHPRMDADPAHQWFRDCVHETCGGRKPHGVDATSGKRTVRSA